MYIFRRVPVAKTLFHSRTLNSSIRSNHLATGRPKCAFVATKLDSRSLIRVNGEDALPFLQGLMTNDIAHLDTKPAIYTLFLNHQGRILYDAILYSSNTPTETLIECDIAVKEKLLKHLMLYRIRKKVNITDASELKLSLWVVFDSAHTYVSHKSLADTSNGNSSKRDIDWEVCCSPIVNHSSKRQQLPIATKKGIEGIGDPRLEELGWRVLLTTEDKSIEEEFVKQVPTLTLSEYVKLRYNLGVGEGVDDLPPGNCFPLESNGDYLHGISFHKGCYIGQELTARTHHTGIVRKRLMPFILPSPTLPERADVTSLQLVQESGKPVGKVRGVQGTKGLFLARIQDALSATELKLGNDIVSVVKPSWWPVEASKESRVSKK